MKSQHTDETIDEFEKGLALFNGAREAMQAEHLLKKNGFRLKAVAPPPNFRVGCDIALEVPIIEKLAIGRCLDEASIEFRDIVPLSGEYEKPLSLAKEVDFGDFLMVRAGNMKICVEKTTKKIVNISGGGCPDVPYLAYQLIGKVLSDAPKPSEVGYTLCAYMLDKAYCRIKRLLED